MPTMFRNLIKNRINFLKAKSIPNQIIMVGVDKIFCQRYQNVAPTGLRRFRQVRAQHLDWFPIILDIECWMFNIFFNFL